MNWLPIRSVPGFVSVSFLILLAGCQTTSQQDRVPTAANEALRAPPPTSPAPTASPQLMTFPTIRAVASESGVPPQVLILTGVPQTQRAAALTPRPPSFFWTATQDLRPTGTPDFGGVPHQLTDVGVIFPRWPDDLGVVCYKVIEPPEGLVINNYWSQWDGADKDRVYVYAGATANSASEGRGSLMVAYKWDPCTWDEYIAPEPTGPLEISDASGHILRLEADNKTFYFDIDSRLFVNSFPATAPSVKAK